VRHWAILVSLVLALGLAGCGNSSDMIDKISDIIPDTKKKLPGERQAVFPQGVPGVPQGVPPDLVKGYQQAPETTEPPFAPPTPQPAKPAGGKARAAGAPQNIVPGDDEAAEPEKPKPKPKKQVAAKPTAPPQANQKPGAWPGVPPAQSSAPARPQQSQQPAPWPTPQSQPTAAWPSPPQQTQQSQ
jgi:hypothetical protein